MGWWWGQEQQQEQILQKAKTTPREVSTGTSFESAVESRADWRETPESGTAQQASIVGTSTARSRDEQAYEELKSLFAEIDPQRTAQAAARAKEFLARPKEDYSNSIYSSTMSCSQCFDHAYYCSSIGGQLTSIYRYGALRSCSELWAQWRFCMRTKLMSDDTRQEKIREFNKLRVVKYKVGPSSEDIWDVRKEPVENPFSRSGEQ